MDLWKPFVAESSDEDEMVRYGHTFYAPDWETALEIAKRNGWTLSGEVILDPDEDIGELLEGVDLNRLH